MISISSDKTHCIHDSFIKLFSHFFGWRTFTHVSAVVQSVDSQDISSREMASLTLKKFMIICEFQTICLEAPSSDQYLEFLIRL
jgi:hypothetical protein